MIKIAPSILAADPLNLERDVKAAEKAGCDWIHVDIMDAHFVPNLAYSAETVRRLREVTDLPLDVHLMMDNPEVMIDPFLDAGASCLTIHAETDRDIPMLLGRIRKRGRMAGIALKPGSPVDMIKDILEKPLMNRRQKCGRKLECLLFQQFGYPGRNNICFPCSVFVFLSLLSALIIRLDTSLRSRNIYLSLDMLFRGVKKVL